MSARNDYIREKAQTATADEIVVEFYDATDKGDRYQVELANTPILDGWFYVDDGEITPDMPTRATRPRRYLKAAKRAIRSHVE